MHPQQDQERQPLLSGHPANYSAVPQQGMQRHLREGHAGTTTENSSLAVDVDHLLATSASAASPRQEPPHDAPEPSTATAVVATTSTSPLISSSSSDTRPVRNVISSKASTADAHSPSLTRHAIYRLTVWTIGLVLLALLLTALVSPLVAQRVLDHALVLQIQQTEISAVDDTGFTVHLKSSVSIDPAHDGVFGLTNWAQRLQPELTIEPTTLHLLLPYARPFTTTTNSMSMSSMSNRSSAATTVVQREKSGVRIMRVPDMGKRMASFHVPRQVIRMSKEATLLEVTTHVTVTDASVLGAFFQSALAESVLDLGVEGTLRTRMGKLWFLNLRLARLVPVEGMKSVQDATLVSMALPGDDPQGGVTMEGVARLHNPSSSLSIDLGKVTFGVYLSTTNHENDQSGVTSYLHHQYKVAELQCSHVELQAHKTVDLAVTGRLFHLDDWVLATAVAKAPAAAAAPAAPTAPQSLKSEKELLLSGLLSRFIQGEDSLVAIRALAEPGMAPWLQVVVQSIALEVRFPGSPQKEFIQGIDMKQLSFGFDSASSSPSGSAELRGRLSARLQLPENVTFPIRVAELYPDVGLFPLEERGQVGQTGKVPNPMARIELPGSLPAESKQDGNALQVQVSFDSGKLVVLPGRQEAFNRFLNDSFSQDEITLGVIGQARALVETGMGSFELGPIPFVTRTTQKGLGGLIGVPPKLEQIDVVDSTERSLTIRARMVITNPSSISASLGPLSFFWGYQGFLIGLATVPNATLQPGPNVIETIGMMDPGLDCAQRVDDPTCDPEQAVMAARGFLSGYISGDNSTTIDVLGHAGSTKIPLLQPVISSLKIRSTLPVMEQDFLLSTTMYLLSSSIVLELRNPLDTAIWVLYINGTASYKDEPLGHVRVDFEHDITTPKPIEIPANDHEDDDMSGYVKTPRLPVSFDLSSIGHEAMKRALGGTLEVDTLCHIKARVGNMVLWIDYRREKVPAKIRKGLF